MDKNEKQAELINVQETIEAYLDHPLSKEILKDNHDRAEEVKRGILFVDPVDVQTFIMHFVAIGEYRGLVRARTMVTDRLEEVKQEIKELN